MRASSWHTSIRSGLAGYLRAPSYGTSLSWRLAPLPHLARSGLHRRLCTGSRYMSFGPPSILCMSPGGRRVGTSVRPAAPKLKYPRARDQRTWIFRRTFEVKQRGLHFVAAGDRLRNDQVGRRIEGRPWEGFRFTFYCDGLDDLDFRPADAGFQEVGIELAPD